MDGLVTRILVNHGVPVRLVAGKVEALDQVYDRDNKDCSKWISVDDWGPGEVLDFLGY